MMHLFFIFNFLSSFSTFAQVQTHTGSYYVPSENGNVMPLFMSEVTFEGDNIAEASEFSILFPTLLVGLENRFVITKTENGWQGDSNLFDKVECGLETQFDFSCELHFNKARVFDITETEQANASHLPLAMAGLPGLTPLPAQATHPTPSLLIDRNQALENLEAAGFSDSAIAVRLMATDLFSIEPIGFFNYNLNGLY